MALARPITPAPFFSIARAEWIPYALTWDPDTGDLRGVEGPRGFETYENVGTSRRFHDPYREAVEASRFLNSLTLSLTDS